MESPLFLGERQLLPDVCGDRSLVGISPWIYTFPMNFSSFDDYFSDCTYFMPGMPGLAAKVGMRNALCIEVFLGYFEIFIYGILQSILQVRRGDFQCDEKSIRTAWIFGYHFFPR